MDTKGLRQQVAEELEKRCTNDDELCDRYYGCDDCGAGTAIPIVLKAVAEKITATGVIPMKLVPYIRSWRKGVWLE